MAAADEAASGLVAVATKNVVMRVDAKMLAAVSKIVP